MNSMPGIYPAELRFLLSERCLDGFYVHIFDGWLPQQLFDCIDFVIGNSPVPASLTL